MRKEIFCFFFIFSCCMIGLSHGAKAQNISQLGRFSVEYKKGCVPLTVKVSELAFLDPKISKKYSFLGDFSIVDQDITLRQFTYTKPGIYKIVQLVGANSLVSNKTDTVTVQVFPVHEPEVSVSYCENFTVQITLTDSTYDYYQIKVEENAPKNFAKGTTLTELFSDSDKQYFNVVGYYDHAPHNCGTKYVNLSKMFSSYPQVQTDSIRMKRTCKNEYQLYFYGNYDSLLIYNIRMKLKDNSSQNIFKGKLISGNFATPISLDLATKIAAFEIAIFNPCTDILQNKETISGEKIKKVEPLTTIYSTFQEEQIKIHINEFNPGLYKIYKNKNEEGFQFLTATTGDFVDSNTQELKNIEYKITFLDSCNFTWDEVVTNPPHLSVQYAKNNQYTLKIVQPTFKWNKNNSTTALYESEKWVSKVEAENYVYHAKMKDGISQKLYVRSSLDNLTLQSNSISVTAKFHAYLPSAFTPNGDNLNDVLEVLGSENIPIRFKIFNRWGKKIYDIQTTNPTWDGTVNGKTMEMGAYFYEISTLDTPTQKQSGTFVILK